MFYWHFPNSTGRYKWHSKVALKLKYKKDGNYLPLSAMVGSSNLSHPAFNLNSPSKTAQECNVYIESGRVLMNMGVITIGQMEKNNYDMEEEKLIDFDIDGNWGSLLSSASLPVRPVGWKEQVELNRLSNQLEKLIGLKLPQCTTHNY
ncbi:hypothetical protein [Oceanobacillus limi]|uniref:hypothetical protein n=1 Tax=Oceanobacillus limi TaxID=930131 RepID=UPI00147C2D0A|nr:hypothetical protein [Oceanobacillus limi]